MEFLIIQNYKENEQISLNKQIEEQIEQKYQFEAYNGLRQNKYDKLKGPNMVNPFSNKVVIVMKLII